jgi:hypothetical protein
MNKTVSMLSVCLAVIAGGLIYNSLMLKRDRDTFLANTLKYNKVLTEPATITTREIDGLTMHTRCESGWCVSSTHLADIDKPLIREKASGGIPTYDPGAFTELSKNINAND